MIILDFGSGNTCKNDPDYIIRMIDELDAVDSRKHEVIIKWQLFNRNIGKNEVLQSWAFSHAFNYATTKGYRTTASVFDKEALKFLLGFDVPFIKLANRPDLYWLAGEVPRKIPVYASFSNIGDFWSRQPEWTIDEVMWCVSKYPATIEDYEKNVILPNYKEGELAELLKPYSAISDHTTDFTLYHKYKPKIYECHYKLADSTGLDAGDFARTPDALSEIL